MEGLTPVYFVKLELRDGAGRMVSDNFYWFSSKEKVDFSDLTKLQKVDLEITPNISYQYDEVVIKVEVKNPTNQLAFFNRLMVTKGKGGEEVLPTFWSDNYFSLLPGESKTLTAKLAKQDLDGEEPLVVLDMDI
jgi:hypothetical protein